MTHCRPTRSAHCGPTSPVSRLRSALAAPDRLLHRAPGYLLVVADGELDAAEFARLVAAARVAGDDHERTVERLDAALTLWRGAALAECADLDFGRAEIARLDDLRRVAVEERIDALMHLGRDSEVIAELESLVRATPTGNASPSR